MLIREYGATNFVTGLRAVAAFLVIGIHTGAFSYFGPLGENLTQNGKYGVQMFFVISGFAVAGTFTREHSFQAYLARRMFRIAPLYYVVVGLMFGLIVFGVVAPPNHAMDFYTVFMHFAFLSGWDARIVNSVLGVQWTIPVEVFWYLFLPLLLPLAASQRWMWKTLLAITVFSVVSQTLGDLLFETHAGSYLPTTHGAYFFAGAIAWFSHSRGDSEGAERKKKRIAVAGFLILVSILFLPTIRSLSPVFVGVSTAMILSSFRQNFFWTPLSTRPFLLLGSISYSLYLWHLLVITLLSLILPQWQSEEGLPLFALVSLISIFVSILSYIMIERPTNRLGSLVALKLNR